MLRFGNAISTNINLRVFRRVSISTKSPYTTPKFCSQPIRDINISSESRKMSTAVGAKIAPSMLSSDFANLASEAERMVSFGADWLHMDIMRICEGDMERVVYVTFQKKLQTYKTHSTWQLRVSPSFYDYAVYTCQQFGDMVNVGRRAHFAAPNSGILQGHFVPNLTIGAPVIESLRKHTKAYLDCHLMVTNPLDYVEQLGKAGASGFTFHVEVSKDNWQELVHQIKSKGMRPGVALKPGTPIEEVYPLLLGEHPVEMVLVMTVEPGFGGQKFMPEMMNKVRTLREKYPTLDIEVDGGLGPSTIDAAAAAGANCIVAGSSVFRAAEPAEVISLLRKSVNNAQKIS